MKKIITAFVFCFLCGECFSQAGEWVWIKGDSVPNQPGNFGVQGVPGPTNNPPSVYEPCEWTDLNGNFWLFGGLDNTGNIYNDLWKYDPLTNEWTWIKGPGVPNNPGNYGIQGVPSPANIPPSRSWGVPTGSDNQGNLWMFGGGIPGGAPLNDLWKYNISANEWTWMKGSDLTGQAGNYGIQGVPSPSNTPGARMECATGWTDMAGDFWLFGGWDIAGTFNDLWRYNSLSNEWTWMKGSSLTNQPGVYGIMGTENSLNTPGARMSHCRWKDNTGNFWLLGGTPLGTAYNDLWRYNLITNNWAWMSGSNAGGATGNYGTKCIDSISNSPQSRFENRAAWTDQSGDLWFFGGWATANDLWKYCISADQWVWISGDSAYSTLGNWGALGVSNPANKPNSRGGSVGWTDNDGHLFLFGGAPNPSGSYNDLWKYTIDTTCGVCPVSTGIKENNPPKADELFIFPNPANSSLTISFLQRNPSGQSTENQNIELRIYNTLGEVQLFQSFIPISIGMEKFFSKEINVEKLSGGIYFLHVKMEEHVMTRKIVVR
ncbi:MAG TPA: kelch repeat-containing protein [Bacteroidia bacterium]|nr:kelch repeat-containing protein [Bacteroidia bacterium]